MNADVIIAVCAPTRACLQVASVAIRTCVEYSGGANVVIAANNMPVPDFKRELEDLTNALGATWSWYGDGPFNICKCFNTHIDSTSRKYCGLFGQDVIFYDSWLSNLIDAWEIEPDYFCLSPYSFNVSTVRQRSFNETRRRRDWRGQNAILDDSSHCAAGMVFRRDKIYHYDEQCPGEGDSDLYWLIKHHGLREGIAMNSSVDHLCQVVLTEMGGWGHVLGPGYENGTDYLRKKWNIT